MARRVLSLVVMTLLGAATAEAATPLDTFARFIGDMTAATNGVARPARPSAATVLKTAPLPNLRPTPSPAPPAANALPSRASAYTGAPATAAPKSSAKAAVAAVATGASLSQAPSGQRSAPVTATAAASSDAAKPAAQTTPAAAAAVATAALAPANAAKPLAATTIAVPVAAADAKRTAGSLASADKPSATAAAGGAAVTTAALEAPAAAPQKSTTAKPAAAAAEVEKPFPTPSAFPRIPAEGTTACAVALAAFGVKATAAPGLGEGECRVAAPVTLTHAGDIALMPKALVDCATAATIAAWLNDTVAPKAQAMLGAELTAIKTFDAYNCRTTNNVKGADLSEHARGRAIDIAAFKVGERWITVGAKDLAEADQKFLDAVRASACGPFTTVLGPGTDPQHHNHFHLDLASRQTAGPSHGLYCR